MIVLAAASAIGVILIVGLAMILPCKACDKRRERLRAAYDVWRARQNTSGKDLSGE